MLENDLKNSATIGQTVTSIWCDVLRTESSSSDDNFFDLGGNSLAALKFLLEIERFYGEGAITPDQLYRQPTIASIVQLLTDRVNRLSSLTGTDCSDRAM